SSPVPRARGVAPALLPLSACATALTPLPPRRQRGAALADSEAGPQCLQRRLVVGLAFAGIGELQILLQLGIRQVAVDMQQGVVQIPFHLLDQDRKSVV